MIIGLDGYVGSGKDTCADILVKQGFVKIAFADSLREEVSKAFNIPYNDFIDRDVKDREFDTPFTFTKKDLTKFCTNLGYKDKVDKVIEDYEGFQLESPRHLLQIAGTEIGRVLLDNLIWIKKYKEKIKDYSNIVTPDCRFENERNTIRDLKGKVAFVDNPNITNQVTHKSGNDKWPIEDYDLVIKNDSTVANLQHELSLWWSLSRRTYRR